MPHTLVAGDVDVRPDQRDHNRPEQDAGTPDSVCKNARSGATRFRAHPDRPATAERTAKACRIDCCHLTPKAPDKTSPIGQQSAIGK